MTLQEIFAVPLLGILRGAPFAALEPLADVANEVGLSALEVTMNTEGAAEQIAHLARLAGPRLTIGAGTVLDVPQLDAALQAGARFIVMPVLEERVAAECRQRRVPFIAGALTPQEVLNAHRSGASMVKLFPANRFGPNYVRELRGPLGDIPLLACGGVRRDDVAPYFDAGVRAVAFGASVFRSDWLSTGACDHVRDATQQLLNAYQEWEAGRAAAH